jgi:hypothetical protein
MGRSSSDRLMEAPNPEVRTVPPRSMAARRFWGRQLPALPRSPGVSVDWPTRKFRCVPTVATAGPDSATGWFRSTSKITSSHPFSLPQGKAPPPSTTPCQHRRSRSTFIQITPARTRTALSGIALLFERIKTPSATQRFNRLDPEAKRRSPNSQLCRATSPAISAGCRCLVSQ